MELKKSVVILSMSTHTEGISVMSIEDRAKATAKNVEGKVKETVGDLTGDKSTEAEGKAQQVEASADHAKEDLKDNVKKAID